MHQDLNTPAAPDPTTLKILIVDDEPMLRSVIEEFLSLLGFHEPLMAGDGREALEMLRAHPVDCMISDIRMPEMALEELLQVVGEEFPRLEVIATSGYSDFEQARAILDKGAYDFLGKPLNLDALEVALTWISHRRPILTRAAQLFVRVNGIERLAESEAAFAELRWMLGASTIPFRSRMLHCQRMADLAAQLPDVFKPGEQQALRLAAALHEMGSSYIMQSLCEQPRRLEENEINLVRAQYRVSGRLVARYLNRPDLQAIIGAHGEWFEQDPRDQANWPREHTLAVWLGLLNFVDSCLHDRPDRTGYPLAQVRDSLERRYGNIPLGPIRSLLDCWTTVEQVMGG